MPVTTRAASTAKRRRKILEAALQCFLERGFAAATAEEIRARSGASIGSIYHHFGGKEGLAGTLHVEGLRDYQAGFLRELRRHRDARSGVQAVVRYHLRWVQEHADWARFLFHLREAEAVQAVKPELREINARFAAAVADWVRPHMQSGVITPLPADVIGAVWIGPAQQFARQWLAGHAGTTLQKATRILAAAAWKSLRADAGGDSS
jgi:AcrR family transcriptional regulator